MKSEKAISAKDGSNTDLTNKLTMNNSNTNQNNFQSNSAQSRANLLERSKLSRLPQRAPIRLPDFDNAPTKFVAVCAGCGARLDLEDAIQKKFFGCRKCISVYGRLDAAREENAKRETRELLEKFAAEVKQ